MITDLNVGGAERALVSLALHLDKSRWQPVVFCLDNPGPLVEVLRLANIPCECLNVHNRNPIHAIGRLTRGFRRYKPLLVQSFMFHANLAARLPRPSGLVFRGLSVGCVSPNALKKNGI